MRAFWIFTLPILFIPNIFGFTGETQFGDLEFMDIVVVFLLPLLWLFRKSHFSIQTPSFLYLRNFIIWSYFGLVVFVIKFNYPNSDVLLGSLSRLSKFSLYCYFAYLVARRYEGNYFRLYYLVVLIISMEMAFSNVVLKFGMDLQEARKLYSADNIIASALAMSLSFLSAILINNRDLLSKWMFRLSLIVYPFVLLGLFLSDGRGSMVAYLVSALYIFNRRINKRRVWLASLSFLLLGLIFYQSQDEFRYDVDRTFFAVEEYNQSVETSFDDGRRLSAFANEFPKFLSNPIFGTGFFHRGYLTDLISVGSHNFLLQMLLETGLIGMFLWISFLKALWKEKGHFGFERRCLLITAFICSLSGEYFYGSEALMIFLLLLVPVLSFNRREFHVSR